MQPWKRSANTYSALNDIDDAFVLPAGLDDGVTTVLFNDACYDKQAKKFSKSVGWWIYTIVTDVAFVPDSLLSSRT